MDCEKALPRGDSFRREVEEGRNDGVVRRDGFETEDGRSEEGEQRSVVDILSFNFPSGREKLDDEGIDEEGSRGEGKEFGEDGGGIGTGRDEGEGGHAGLDPEPEGCDLRGRGFLLRVEGGREDLY